MGNAASILRKERFKSEANDSISETPLMEEQGLVFDETPISMQDQQGDGVQSATVPTVMRWDGGGKKVYVSGSFSKWKALPMIESLGDFFTIVNIPEGDHLYKFLVDGEWKYDPKMKCVEDAGVTCNLVTVGQTISEYSKRSSRTVKKRTMLIRRSGVNIFQRQTHGARNQARQFFHPICWRLPPTKTLHYRESPILAEPNSSTLNHMYATSIVDGVMVLSTTQRNRNKNVTRLFYKPI
ncbi:hypothetical protein ZHAS_00004492 [Anopheles sinensis]|uniref:5'-AMP-activated protein kinase subunit beta-1 n=1 Tax=Anopheles sinensis TaxID=74873 RepID=A0A084VH27_ANOSI|nr:hypothetical protein ZHAS_00004492 [Anopheles sinensis]